MRDLSMVYGLFCYLVGNGSLVLFMFFANNDMAIFGVESIKSWNIDRYNAAPSDHPLLVNISLLLLFGLQHSIMARAAFKKQLVKFIPETWERSTYLLATGVVFLSLILLWQPIVGTVWHVEDKNLRLGLNIIYYMGWIISFTATYMLNHFHLFGLQQTFSSDDLSESVKIFHTPLLYKVIRHPIQAGVVISMLATPDMTYGRAVLAIGMLSYIAIGLYFEEKDLISEFGDTYRDYKARVPAIFPFLKRKRD